MTPRRYLLGCAETETKERLSDAAYATLDAFDSMLAALNEAETALDGTLRARGMTPDNADETWAPEVRAEVLALDIVRRALAKAEGQDEYVDLSFHGNGSPHGLYQRAERRRRRR